VTEVSLHTGLTVWNGERTLTGVTSSIAATGTDTSDEPESEPLLSSKARRSAATKARLLDATIECLVELGWSGTSTTEVVRRAGVSRGAQVHHYPTKEDLVLAALEHLLMRRNAEFREVFSRLPVDERTPGKALDLLWEGCSGDTGSAWIELAVAGRSNPALRKRFVEIDERFWEASLATFHDLFPEAADDSLARVSLRLAFAVVNGMATQRLTGSTPEELTETLEAFKFLTTQYFTPETEPGDPA
jgi:AcrR family transcriptional regulator